MKKTILALMGALALMLGGLSLSPASASVAPAPGTSDLRVVKVGTDAMGTDNFGNRNREFVTFKNVSDHTVDVANLLVEDNWAHGRTLAHRSHSCNTYKITDLPDNGTTEIASGEFVTVFNGSRIGGNYKNGSEYRLFANSDTDCGTYGHYLNNDADTVWVTLADGTSLTSKSWDWGGGYYVYGH